MVLRDHVTRASYSATFGRSPEAVAALKRAAAAGEAAAQYQWAEHLYWGLEATFDREQAFAWMQQAAAQAYLPAVLFLGLMHQFAEGTPENPAAAREAFRRAEALGSLNAVVAIGEMEDDEARLRQGAEAGHPVGMALWGHALRDKGQAEAALNWLTRAAEAGAQGLEPILGYMYEYGEGSPVNPEAAIRWYREAARLGGEPELEFRLGKLYADKEDWAQAYVWLELAVDGSHEMAGDWLAAVAPRLSEAEKRQAYEAWVSWKEGLE